jgi:formate dehydrogenase iron-sulfur subunit
MSSTSVPPNELPKLESAAHDFDLLGRLLSEQKDMSAVELFTHWHGTSPQATSEYRALLPTSAPQPGQQYAFEVNLDACSGCKACVVACHTLNGLDEHETWRKVGLLNSTSSTLPIVQHVTTTCHHCVDPGCLNGCPVLAYEKDPMTGIVRHLDDQCFGCKYCLMMCPYEVPQYNPSLGIVRKCDMCAGRLELGEAPACVQACPTSAIRISILDVAVAREVAGGSDRLLSTAPLSQWTQPTTQFTSMRLDSLKQNTELVSRESVSEQRQPGHEPLVAMLVLTQASVGVWCAIAAAYLFDLMPANSALSAGLAATIVGVIGIQAALLHLGRPMLAFRSVLGWRTSWLSREAIAFGLYLGTALLAIAVTSGWIPAPPTVASVAVNLAALSGCAAVYCSAMIYVATRREIWSAPRTLLEFSSTTIGLGLAILSLFAEGTTSQGMLFGGMVACFVALLPKILDWRAASKGDVVWNDFSARSGRLLRGELRTVYLSIFTCFVAAGILVGASYLLDESVFKSVLLSTAVAGLMVAQLLMRWLYFASVVFARMPGANT